MREPFASRSGKLALSLLLAVPRILPGATASIFDHPQLEPPALHLSRLGRVAFAGDFDAISLYQYAGQTERAPDSNGGLITQLPNGIFTTIQNTDGEVKTMCLYNGNIVVVGGNFTSVGGQKMSGGIALLDTTDGSVKPIEGLTGSVNALYCDVDRSQIYVGGSFDGVNSTNAIIWKDGWESLSFQGFNGPVHSILKAQNGNMIFGGQFDGVGSPSGGGPAKNNTQALPLGSANLTAQTSSGRPGLTEPSNIACKTDVSTQGPNSTWLLADNTPGFWSASFGFGFKPTKLRLHNTDFEGRGTRTWRYTALPDGGIMNFTYVDPASGQQSYCDAECPLPYGNTTGQDFYFVNQVGMNAFRIDISAWYGQGGGLNAVELFSTDVFSYAINEFNAPKCGGSTTGASATATGPWFTTPSHDSNAQYLTATLQTANLDPSANLVVFSPNIPQSGNYTLRVYTPGCKGDGTCGTRGRVNITCSMSSSKSQEPTSVEIFQTNEFDKYDEICTGFADATDGFSPTVTLAPVAGQDPGTGVLTVVAQRIGYEIRNTSNSELNGLFEYETSKSEADKDLLTSAINAAGAKLVPSERAAIVTLATVDDKLFIGGNFSSSEGFNNIFAYAKDASGATTLSGNGLNSEVLIIQPVGDIIYVGGNFTNTQNNAFTGLNGVAAYKGDEWQALGAGVNGVVQYIVPFSMNITANTPEEVLGISGIFNQVYGFNGNAASSVDNSAIWIPSRNNWLQNLDLQTLYIRGRLTSFVNVNSDRLFAGAISSQTLAASGAAALQSNGGLSLQGFSMDMGAQQPQRALGKRSLTEGQNLTSAGIVTGIFSQDVNMNKTILAGHFATTGSDGQNISNVAIIDGQDSDKITGFSDSVDTNSTFAALAAVDGILYAGGAVTGQRNNVKIGGIVAYDLTAKSFANTQPPALQGTNVTVNTIAHRPNSKDIFVAGRFQSAGSLSCPALCIWNTERNQWTSPGGDISGVVTSFYWISGTKALLAGDLTINNNQTRVFSYDTANSQFQPIAGAKDLPGSVTALTLANADGSQIWAAGESKDGSAFLQRFDGNKWFPINGVFGPGTTIRGIQVFSLSQDHGTTDLIDRNLELLILGQVNITNFGTASAALFNGTTLTPFLLSSAAENSPGSLSQVFVEKSQFFAGEGSHLALGFIILIALAIALVLTFLLVVAGIFVEWYRKRAQGYSLAPTSYTDRMGNVGRLPPEQLLGTLSSPRGPAI